MLILWLVFLLLFTVIAQRENAEALVSLRFVTVYKTVYKTLAWFLTACPVAVMGFLAHASTSR